MINLSSKEFGTYIPTETPSPSWFAVRALEGFNTSSELFAAGALNIADFKKLEKTDDVAECWRCGGDIHTPMNEGFYTIYKPKPKFNDHWECVGTKKESNKRDIKYLCVACEAVSHATYHPNFRLNALYTENKAYQLTLDEDLISFLINPPAPPYLFSMAENNSQHMCWLSRFTLDNKLMCITKGRSTGLIDREKALTIATKMHDLLSLANQIRKLGGAIGLSTPLMSGRKEINTIDSTNLQLSRSIHGAARKSDKDTEEISELKSTLQARINEFENLSYCYLTWYVATMFLKAMLTEFTPKPMSEWQLIKAPKR